MKTSSLRPLLLTGSAHVARFQLLLHRSENSEDKGMDFLHLDTGLDKLPSLYCVLHKPRGNEGLKCCCSASPVP